MFVLHVMKAFGCVYECLCMVGMASYDTDCVCGVWCGCVYECLCMVGMASYASDCVCGVCGWFVCMSVCGGGGVH
jgi:hypothetical protein